MSQEQQIQYNLTISAIQLVKAISCGAKANVIARLRKQIITAQGVFDANL